VVPRKNGFGSNDLRHLGQRFPPQPSGYLGQADSFRIGESDSAFDLTTQNSVLCHQILISLAAQDASRLPKVTIN
jgi:hypothetical protein